VEMLQYLSTVAKGPSQQVEVLVHVVSALFDINPSMSTHMAVPLWKRCTGTLLQVLGLLQQHQHVVLDDTFDSGLVERTEEPDASQGDVHVWGSLVAFVERLDDELFKSLQVIDPHTHQYMERMRDEVAFLALAGKAAEYLERRRDTKNQARIALRRVEHFYVKTDDVYGAIRRMAAAQKEQTDAAEKPAEEAEADMEQDPEDAEMEAATAGLGKETVQLPADFQLEESCQNFLFQQCGFIYKHGDERTKARAMLCTIFFKAIHDDFHGARDSLLMSHLQDSVPHMDISTQILYNRAVAQMGLAAFRAGLVVQAHNCLSELYASGRVKELLAQGMSLSRNQDRTPEQEKLERRRQMPFHMHINLELLEAVHLICAMLLEVPSRAAVACGAAEARRRPISKPWERLMSNFEKQTFTGPPENVRDHVMAASRALMGGDWRQAYEHVASLTVWSLLSGKHDPKALMRSKLQECGLQTYLFASGSYYQSLSLEQLCQMFELPEERVHGIVSKMMMDEGLQGSWDQPTRTIVMHSAMPTRLQALATEFADKASMLVDLNERALALRTGGLSAADDEGGEGGQGGRRGDRNGRYGEGGQGGFGGNRRGGRGGLGISGAAALEVLETLNGPGGLQGPGIFISRDDKDLREGDYTFTPAEGPGSQEKKRIFLLDLDDEGVPGLRQLNPLGLDLIIDFDEVQDGFEYTPWDMVDIELSKTS
ncbi:hypothetical protein WJX84_011860, partial [Apatococcus fuscideae]